MTGQEPPSMGQVAFYAPLGKRDGEWAHLPVGPGTEHWTPPRFMDNAAGEKCMLVATWTVATGELAFHV